MEVSGNLIEVVPDPAVFGGQLANGSEQIAADQCCHDRYYSVISSSAGSSVLNSAIPSPKYFSKKSEIKLEDVRAVLAEKSRAGHTAEVRTLLQKYGAAKLSGVDPANYKALLKDVEGLDHA